MVPAESISLWTAADLLRRSTQSKFPSSRAKQGDGQVAEKLVEKLQSEAEKREQGGKEGQKEWLTLINRILFNYSIYKK